MGRRVKISPGYTNIALFANRLLSAGDEVVITDEQWGYLNDGALPTSILDLGPEGSIASTVLASVDTSDATVLRITLP